MRTLAALVKCWAACSWAAVMAADSNYPPSIVADSPPLLLDHRCDDEAAGAGGACLWEVSLADAVPGRPPLPASVPGDLISDLQRAGAVGDPYFETNFLDNRSVWQPDFVYSRSVPASALPATPRHVLVLESVKMGAVVSINGLAIGTTTDQFLRYEFDATAALARLQQPEGSTAPPAAHRLSVRFDSAIATDGRFSHGQRTVYLLHSPSTLAGISTGGEDASTMTTCRRRLGRFMASTGGWDWAPWSHTWDGVGAPTFSKGIIGSVYLLGVHALSLQHLVVQTFYRGKVPTAPIRDGQHAGFNVSVRLHLAVAAQVQGSLTVRGSWSAAAVTTQAVTLAPAADGDNAVVSVSLVAAAEEITLWWPVGVGTHQLYTVTAAFTPAGADRPSIESNRSVGFRTASWVTANDSDPAVVNAGGDGSASPTFTTFVRINGARIYARGANMVPALLFCCWR